MKALLCGDFARATGYSGVNECVASELTARGWDVAVLAAGYGGQPHPLQARYRLWPAPERTDFLGLNRLADVVRAERPDVVLVTATPWVVARYLNSIPPGVPVAAYMPVDAPNLDPAYVQALDRLALAIPYTRFAEDELRTAGYAGPSTIIPHGIAHDTFYPVPQAEARAALGLDPDLFIVPWIDRNQPRKRLDLAMRAFARFAADKPEARLLLHTGARDVGWNPAHEAHKAGCADKVILTSDSLSPESGWPVDELRVVYSAADVRLSTTAGEGWGLTIMEAMACGLPVAAPDWSALGEWAAPAALLYPVAGTQSAINRTGTDEAVIDPADAATALEALYQRPDMRDALRAAGLALTERECYRWPVIGAQFDEALRYAVAAQDGRSGAEGAEGGPDYAEARRMAHSASGGGA